MKKPYQLLIIPLTFWSGVEQSFFLADFTAVSCLNWFLYFFFTLLERMQFPLRSQIEGYTCLLIFRKFSTLPAVIWASPFINFQENFQPPCFFTYINEKISSLPSVIWASPFINIQENFQLFCFFTYTNDFFYPPLCREVPWVLVRIWKLYNRIMSWRASKYQFSH